MEIYIGTSGWLYDWNPDGFDWYVKHSGLNSVELNASFYRFPFPNQVKAWARKGSSLRWSIKVNRFITHVFKLSDKALSTWSKFKRLFKPMEQLIDFYLFQMPPNFSSAMVDRVERFIHEIGSEKVALEFRHLSWFKEEYERWADRLGITLVSIDAPIASWIWGQKVVYMRMHGRGVWYAYRYAEDELREISSKIMEKPREKVYIYFNNDHDMLDNARLMKIIMGKYI